MLCITLLLPGAGWAAEPVTISVPAATLPEKEIEALERWQKAAEQNDPEAVKWCQKAANEGNAEAQYQLGRAYEFGWGVPRNGAEAIKWFRKAAEQGNADAERELGWCYAGGLFVPRNKAEAIKWYRKAAEQGNTSALFGLGNAYSDRKAGIPWDYVQAYMWTALGAEIVQGPAAKQDLDDLARRMTPDQIAEAQRLAQQWRREHPPRPPAPPHRVWGITPPLGETNPTNLRCPLD